MEILRCFRIFQNHIYIDICYSNKNISKIGFPSINLKYLPNFDLITSNCNKI